MLVRIDFLDNQFIELCILPGQETVINKFWVTEMIQLAVSQANKNIFAFK